MSFLNVLKSVGSVFGKVTAVVTPLEPVIAGVPVYGTVFNTVFNAIVGIESLFAGAVSAGAAKKSAVTAIVNATSPVPIAESTLSETIDKIVAGLNALQGAHAAVTPNPA